MKAIKKFPELAAAITHEFRILGILIILPGAVSLGAALIIGTVNEYGAPDAWHAALQGMGL